ncbi:hypothetical protein KKA95_02760 [Patescibacteria group bacterium]|nr:hypothetical protein [Patescibacteria group bacterium]
MFNNSETNFFNPNRSIFVRPSEVAAQSESEGDKARREGARYYIPNVEQQKPSVEQGALDQGRQTREALDAESATVGPTPQERKKRERVLENRAEKKGIYENREGERLQDYIDRIVEAIETPKFQDDLYEYILQRTPEGNPRKTPPIDLYNGDYRKWNEAFCAIMNEHLPENMRAGEGDVIKQKRIVYALQSHLAVGFKEDIFQLNRKEAASQFVYVDGLMGAYSVSVLAKFWNNKFDKQDDDRNPLTRSALEPEWAKKSGREAEFNKAIAYLQTKMGEGEPEARLTALASRLDSISNASVRETALGIKAELEKGSASPEALFAFEQSYLGDKAMKKLIADTINNPELANVFEKEEVEVDGKKKMKLVQNVANWQRIHGYMMQDTKYAEAYNSAQTQAETVIRLPDSTIEGEIKGETVGQMEIVDLPPTERRVDLATIKPEDLPQSVRESAVRMTSKYRERELARYPNGYEGMSADSFDSLLEVAPPDHKFEGIAELAPKGHNYGGIEAEGIDGGFNLRSYPRDSWPQQAYRLYENAYEEWQEKNSYYEKNVKNNALLSPQEKKAKEDEVEEFKNKRNEAYDNLCLAVNEYHKADYQIRVNMADNYEQDLYRAALKYDFPEGKLSPEDEVSDTDLSKLQYNQGTRFDKYRGRHARKYPKDHNDPDTYGIPQYLKEIPVRTISSPEDIFPYLRGETQEEIDKNKAELGVYMTGYDFVDAMNHFIYINNYKRFLKDFVDTETKTYPVSYTKQIDSIATREPLENMIERVKSRESDIENQEQIKAEYARVETAYNERLSRLKANDNWDEFLGDVLKGREMKKNEAPNFYDEKMKNYENLSKIESDRPGLAKAEMQKAKVLMPIYDEVLARMNEYERAVESAKKSDEIALPKDDYIKAVTEMIGKDDNDFDFNGVGQQEQATRIYFAKNMFDMFTKLGIPTSRNSIAKLEEVMKSTVVDSDGNIDYGVSMKTKNKELIHQPIRTAMVESYTEGAYAYADNMLVRKADAPIAVASM